MQKRLETYRILHQLFQLGPLHLGQIAVHKLLLLDIIFLFDFVDDLHGLSGLI